MAGVCRFLSRSSSLHVLRKISSIQNSNCRVDPKFWRCSSYCTFEFSCETKNWIADFRSLGHITRRSFPILENSNSNSVYLNSAATTHKPVNVLQALDECDIACFSNVRRDIYCSSAGASDLYEEARSSVALLINARDKEDIVFTRNATEAISLVAFSWGLSNLRDGDEIILTIAEHHSAIVPWEFVAKERGATIKYVGLTEEAPDMEQFKKLLSKKTKLVVIHHVSNTLGSVLPIDEIVGWSHDVGATVLVDACQSVARMVIDVQKLDVDFLVASSHKICGPTGIGFLYGKGEILTRMTPFLGYGSSCTSVSRDGVAIADSLSRFEVGTPAIAQAAGLSAAIHYLLNIGVQRIHDYEMELAEYLYESLLSIPDVRIYGPAPSPTVYRAPICSFNVREIDPTDLASYMDKMSAIVICSGHHYAHPLHRALGIHSSARASLRFYNTKEDVDYFLEELEETVRQLLGHS